ncbi:MAG TPA: flagellar hook-basal body complex protein [Fervidobacterium sp.]|nr:flagellar hook-basal body complex protein [Fervidobacterium sp.]HPT53631.1 flagellar hook-basal body complex protein [Fervidobacterium sp.]HPZ18171.1 flagellar hook-basal body complex protein [Fervidobacterium sp.]HQE48083.1 flagellar hook-basal body complex protein [Fervidobacterium sp.]HUM41755.1 flagellar hook-basal body complex protein [Fervidobacterium sp.]
MMRSLYSGVSGLQGFQQEIDVVSNNIANVNTTGFKGSRVTYATNFSQILDMSRRATDNTGGTNPKQIGYGIRVASIDKMMNQGSFQNTGKKTDLAIQGEGFFILSDGQRYYYTRAGNFDLDLNGTIVQPTTGLKLEGWVAEVDPTTGRRFIDTNKPIGNIQISSGLSMAAKQTSRMSLAGNLDARVGPEKLVISINGYGGKTINTKVVFERDFGGLEDTFGDYQIYIGKVDANLDDKSDGRIYMKFDKFGNVVSSGAIKQTVTGTASSGTLTITTPIQQQDGNYLFIIRDSTGKIVDTLSRNVLNQHLTEVINSEKLVNGETYTVEVASSTQEVMPPNMEFDSQVVSSASAGELSRNFTVQYMIENIDGTPTTVAAQDISAHGTQSITDASLVAGTQYRVKILINGKVFGSEIVTATDDGGSGRVSFEYTQGKYGVTRIAKDSVSGDVLGIYNTLLVNGDNTLYDSSFAVGNAYVDDIYQPSKVDLLAVPGAGEPRFYEADNPTNFAVVSFESPFYTTSTQVYDSLGNPYTLYTDFVKLAPVYGDKENVWAFRIRSASGENIKYLSNYDTATEISGGSFGVIRFDKTGRLLGVNSFNPSTGQISEGENIDAIMFNAGENGDGTVKIKIDLTSMTQFAALADAFVKSQDGNAQGVLESFSISENGEIVGSFTNGLVDTLGKVALATFNNPAGLLEVGNSLYGESANSGTARIGQANKGGFGSLVAGALEMSNVDLSEEFTKLIIAQRGFQANARTITTADQILQEVVNLRR